jgi:membrane-associated protease RseP (regulator of RpoE activity)
MAVVLACVLVVVLVGFALYALRAPSVETTTVKKESPPARDPATMNRLRSFKTDTLEASREEVPEPVDGRRRPEAVGEERPRTLVEGGSGRAAELDAIDARKQRGEKMRAKREAMRAHQKGPRTAADAINRLNLGNDQDSQGLGQNWTPPGRNVLNKLSPELLADLGLEASYDGPRQGDDVDRSYRLVVVGFTSNSAARRAGIEPGDEIVSYFGESVRNIAEFDATKELAESLGAKRIEIVVERSDGVHELEIRSGVIGAILQGE